jgi:hypothetical protein
MTNGNSAERELFEEYMKKEHPMMPLDRHTDKDSIKFDEYRVNWIEDMWESWQARAALSVCADGGKGEAVYQVKYESGAWLDHNREKYEYFGRVGYETRILYTAPQAECAPREAQPVADTVRECLSDVVSHYRALYAGLAFQLNEATNTDNSDDMAYWKHEIKALERMYAQAESALAAPTPERAQPCTCHPDDNPPNPCARKYALNECRRADAEKDVTLTSDLYEILMLQNIVTGEESCVSLRCVGVPPTKYEFVRAVKRAILAANKEPQP